MNLTSVVKLVAVVVIAGLTRLGCGKNASSVGAGNTEAFDPAEAATKANREFARSAGKSNDYAATLLTAQQSLSQPTGTPEQGQAAADTMSSVSDQMTTATAKGDGKAKKGIDAPRKLGMLWRWRVVEQPWSPPLKSCSARREMPMAKRR